MSRVRIDPVEMFAVVADGATNLLSKLWHKPAVLRESRPAPRVPAAAHRMMLVIGRQSTEPSLVK